MSVITRIPPSPTGLLHIGTLRTALYNYLFTKKHNGKMLFRSEDTDKDRSTLAFEQDIFKGLVKLGLIEGNTEIIRQSERTEVYKKYLEKMLEEGSAYYCFCSQEDLEKEKEEQKAKKMPFRYSGKCKNHTKEESLARVESGEKAVIRLRVPENREVTFTDLIRGENTTHTKEIQDFVIAKNLDSPLYHLVVVIDDFEMKVTHVLRGEDHIPNTSKQMLIAEALDIKIPEYGHMPLILNEDKSKLSKRKNKVSVNDYLEEGYLEEAFLNFLVLLGWNDGTDNEIFSLEEMVESFSLDRVHKGGAVFDLKKLEWINSQYIKNLSVEDLRKRVQKYLEETPFYEQVLLQGEEFLLKVLKILQSKLRKLSEIEENLELFYKTPHPELDLLVNEKMKATKEIGKEALEVAKEVFENIDENNFTEESFKSLIVEKIKEKGWKNGQFLWPLRACLSGLEFSPSPFEIAEAIGKQETLHRIERMLKKF